MKESFEQWKKRLQSQKIMPLDFWALVERVKSHAKQIKSMRIIILCLMALNLVLTILSVFAIW